MKKRLISEYSSIILIMAIILLLKLNLYSVAAAICVLWYMLFGFVGVAFSLSIKKKAKLSNIFIVLTLPTLLLPFRKSFYYWVKSVNAVLLNSNNIEKAYGYAQKVNIDGLYTDNNKSMFYAYLAGILLDLNQRGRSVEMINEAKRIPHKAFIDDMIINIEKKSC